MANDQQQLKAFIYNNLISNNIWIINLRNQKMLIFKK